MPTGGATLEASAVEAREAMERRLVDAALACIARHGLAKTTLDDVAREAGCARATVYRYFPSKRALLQAMVADEAARVGDEVRAAGAAAPDLETAVVDMMLTAARAVDGHDALQFVLAHEPEQVLTHLSFSGGDRFLAAASSAFAPGLARFLPAERVPRAAEWCVRVMLAYLGPVPGQDPLTDAATVRDLVRQFVLPGLQAVASTGAPSDRSVTSTRG